MPRAAEYARLRSSGRCPQCGSTVTDYQPSGERYAYCGDCRKARRGERAARRPMPKPKRPPAERSSQQRSLPKRLRLDIAERDGWRCHYCGTEFASGETGGWQIDHREPASRGGSDDPGNLLTLTCTLDNLRKGDLTEREYRDWLADYGSDLPDLDERTWAVIGIIRARVRRELLDACPAAATEHGPCGTCKNRASMALAELHAKGLSNACRKAANAAELIEEMAGAPVIDELGLCPLCSIARDAVWRALGLQTPP